MAHQLGVEPSCETIRTLDCIVSTASASHDQPEPGPSSLGKPPRLEECLTTVEEDTISLGDDDDDPFSNMFDEIDGMVLNRYNAASMDLDVEAALFRQVPFACVLTETDTLPLHVRCRACSTAERTATNIVIAPIARAHRAAPHTPAPCSCSCSLLLLLLLPARAARSRAARSSLALPSLLLPAPAPTAPCSQCSLLRLCSLRSLLPLGFSTALGHFRARTIPYLGFASQRLA